MAIKEVKRHWESCQLDYVKEFLCHTEKDVANLPACCVGSTAHVAETGNVYVCGSDKAWKREEEALGEGGSGLPTGGEPYKQLVTDGEGNAVWEDRLAWSEVVKGAEVIGETTFEAVDVDGVNGVDIVFTLTIGEKYIVIFDGVEYELVAYKRSFAGVTFYFLGAIYDMSVGGTIDWSSAPFLLMEDPADNYSSIATQISGEHTIAVYVSSRTTHPIPAEYLPEPMMFFIDYSNSPYVLYKDESFTNGVTIDDLEDVLGGWLVYGNNLYKPLRVKYGTAGFQIVFIGDDNLCTYVVSSDYVSER